MFNSTALDDPLLFDACAAFDGGVVSNARANLLAANQLAGLINGDITRTGQIITRRGTRRLGSGPVANGRAFPVQGLAYYESPFGGYLVAAAGGALWRFNGGSGGEWSALLPPTASRPTLDARAPVAFARGADLLFFTDGRGLLRTWDGTACRDLACAGHLLAWQDSRLCVAGDPAQPDTISFFDAPLAAAGQLRVGGGEGDPIMALAPWSDFNLVVLKRHGAWVVNTPAMTANAISRRVGCVAARSAVQVGTDVWYLSADGVRSLRRTQGTTQQEVGDALSLPIQDLIDRINPAAASTSCAAAWGSRYLLAVPLDGASAPNAVLVCDTLTQRWTGQWLGWRPLDWAVSAFGGDLRLCFGQADGTVSTWLDGVPALAETPGTFTDASGQPVATVVRTRALTFGDAHSPKTGLQYELEFGGSQADVTVQAVLDGSAVLPTDGLPTGGAALPLPLTLPGVLPRGGVVRRALDLQRFGPFRELQFEVASAGGKLALRAIRASAFADTLEVQT